MLPGDIADVAEDVIAHRLVLTVDALADDIDPRHLVRRVLDAVRPPLVAPAQAIPRRASGPRGGAA